MSQHVDVLIVGAGLSGIGAAYRLQTECPDRTYAILESRDAIGGTWDLFRYPGRPLGLGHVHARLPVPAVDGARRRSPTAPSILRLHRGDRGRVRHRREDPLPPPGAVGAAWSSERRALDGDGRRATPARPSAHLLVPVRAAPATTATTSGYAAEFAGRGATSPARSCTRSTGRRTSTTTGKRVVVIGSGATAVTLVPAMAERAEHVTMLQRSPSYIVSLPGRDPLADALRSELPARAAVSDRPRPRTCCSTGGFYQFSRRWPAAGAQVLRAGVAPAAAGRLRRWTRTSPRRTTRGTSGCAWCPTATCSRRCAAARRRS